MRDPEFAVRIRFNAAAPSLARVRAVVETLLTSEAGNAFRRDEIDEILLGLQESLTNVARHAYPSNEPALVELLVRTAGGRFQACIKDRGRPFEPRAAQPAGAPSAASLEMREQPRSSGYGLMLMDRTMDRVSVRRRGNANVLRLDRSTRRRLAATRGPIKPPSNDPEPISIKTRPVSSR